MGEGAWKGCGEKRKKRCSSCGGFGLVFDRLRWGPAPAASLTGLGSRARDQGRGGNSKRRTGGACRREGRLASPAALRVLWVGGCVTPILPSEEEEAVGCSICIPLGRLALDPRECSCFRLRLRLQNTRVRQIAAARPAVPGFQRRRLCGERLETDLRRRPVIPASASC